MSDSNWEAPTPGTAADTAKPHWSKRKAGPLPVWGWIASGMVLLGIIGAFTDQSDNDETSIPITVETEEDRERREEAEEWFGELQEDWEALEDFFEDVEENGTEMVVDDLEALEDFYDNLSDKTTETADRLLNAIESLRDSDVAAADDDADESVTEERDAAPATTAPPVEITTAPAATPAESVSQREARESAASYLRYSSFSRLGLIDQLEYEGFTTEDATYGVDAQNADWYTQAVLTAENYLDVMSFSRTGLIDQLIYEGFTSAEATHGADSAFASADASGGGETASQANARESAASYLSFMAFSRTGLIEQLEYEGYSTADATYGVDAQNADWNQQAALKAEEYLDFMSFTRSELIDQLLYEGFTQSEATYGVNQVGL